MPCDEEATCIYYTLHHSITDICVCSLWISATFISSPHSNLSLASEDADSPESIFISSSGSSSNGSRTWHSPEKPSPTKRGHLQEANSRGGRRMPASLSGPSSDIPVLLINGAPQKDPGPDFTELMHTVLVSNSKPTPHSESQIRVIQCSCIYCTTSTLI